MKPLILIGMMMLLSGCGAAPAPTPHAFSFLALGDSYTSGESVDESLRWPVQLAVALRSSGIDVGDPTIIAQTGWRTDQLANAIDAENPQGNYALVGLLIGVNNQYQGRSEDEYRAQFGDLLARAIKLAGNRPSRVIVLSIPDWGVTPYARQVGADPAAVGASIDRFNAINKELTAKANAVYVDITPISRDRRDLIADDGLHPSGAMYGKWVEAALPAAKAAIAQK
jgi:lysophospholipase L1-like esterase